MPHLNFLYFKSGIQKFNSIIKLQQYGKIKILKSLLFSQQKFNP